MFFVVIFGIIIVVVVVGVGVGGGSGSGGVGGARGVDGRVSTELQRCNLPAFRHDPAPV